MASEAELQSSRLPNSAPGQWDQSVALREVVRIYLPASVTEVIDEWLGEAFYRWLEHWPGPSDGRSYVELYLNAVTADLQYTARFLALVAREQLVELESTAAQEELAWFADGLAMRVEELADRVVEKLRRLHPAVPVTVETA